MKLNDFERAFLDSFANKGETKYFISDKQYRVFDKFTEPKLDERGFSTNDRNGTIENYSIVMRGWNTWNGSGYKSGKYVPLTKLRYKAEVIKK